MAPVKRKPAAPAPRGGGHKVKPESSKQEIPKSASVEQSRNWVKRPADTSASGAQPAKKHKAAKPAAAKPKFVPPPKNPSQVSSNWKQLAQSMGSKPKHQSNKKKAQPRKAGESEQYVPQ